MSASMKRTRPDFGPAIALFRQIVAQSGDAMLTEGPVNPDHHLLDLCAKALHHGNAEAKIEAIRHEKRWLSMKDAAERQAAMVEDSALVRDWYEHRQLAKPSLIAITKLKATTPAGIYAKAAVVRASKTGATNLAMSLAQDLLDCPGLRAVLWPAEEEPQ